MDPVLLVVILFCGALALGALEAVLPTHGVLGVLGLVLAVWGVVAAFRIHPALGAGSVLVCAAAIPLLWMLFIHVYPRTPIGRKMILQGVESRVEVPAVPIGTTGVAVSELRPGGTCEFGGERMEARSDAGLIPAGTRVRVVNINQGRLIVRPIVQGPDPSTGLAGR
jgi:membrane-bound serine protease (ClpP class)